MAIREIRCPQCHRPTVWADNDNRPFFSERCRVIDLGAWADETYRVPDNTRQSSGAAEEFNN